jgi:hypothetical protein
MWNAQLIPGLKPPAAHLLMDLSHCIASAKECSAGENMGGVNTYLLRARARLSVSCLIFPGEQIQPAQSGGIIPEDGISKHSEK